MIFSSKFLLCEVPSLKNFVKKTVPEDVKQKERNQDKNNQISVLNNKCASLEEPNKWGKRCAVAWQLWNSGYPLFCIKNILNEKSIGKFEKIFCCALNGYRAVNGIERLLVTLREPLKENRAEQTEEEKRVETAQQIILLVWNLYAIWRLNGSIDSLERDFHNKIDSHYSEEELRALNKSLLLAEIHRLDGIACCFSHARSLLQKLQNFSKSK